MNNVSGDLNNIRMDAMHGDGGLEGSSLPDIGVVESHPLDPSSSTALKALAHGRDQQASTSLSFLGPGNCRHQATAGAPALGEGGQVWSPLANETMLQPMVGTSGLPSSQMEATASGEGVVSLR